MDELEQAVRAFFDGAALQIMGDTNRTVDQRVELVAFMAGEAPLPEWLAEQWARSER